MKNLVKPTLKNYNTNRNTNLFYPQRYLQLMMIIIWLTNQSTQGYCELSLIFLDYKNQKIVITHMNMNIKNNKKMYLFCFNLLDFTIVKFESLIQIGGTDSSVLSFTLKYIISTNLLQKMRGKKLLTLNRLSYYID